jgi:hypothetical protein
MLPNTNSRRITNMTEAERKELEALKGKSDLTDDEKARLAALEAKAKEGETFSKEYVESLRKENAKYRTRAKEVSDKLKAFEGIDPDKYKELETASEKAEKERLEKAGEWDKLRDKLVADHQAELAKKDEVIANQQKDIAKLEGEIGKTVRSHQVSTEAMVAEAINPGVVEMIVETKTEIKTTDDGKRVIVVLDAEGNPDIDPKTGKPKTVAQLLQDMKTSKEYAHLFKGGSGGAGSGTENFAGKSIKNPWSAEHSNLTLQGQIIRHDPDQARRMIKEAGKEPATYGL